MFIVSWLKKFFGWFTSPQGKQALNTIEGLATIALTVAMEIKSGAPNRTLDEINSIALKYGLPTITALENAETGTDVSNILLNLGTGILSQYAPVGTTKTIIQTAIQIALSHLQTK